MSFWKPTIFTGFEANMQWCDIRQALFLLCVPHQWRTGASIKVAQQELEALFPGRGITLLDSGRTALFVILKALRVTSGDEVLVQAYTCAVVINAIRWAGATPVFVDCTDEYTMDPHDAAKKCTSKTKAMVVQHSFGIMADIHALRRLSTDTKITVIEDCAHVLNDEKTDHKPGMLGDVSFFSFGSDKPISAVRGGAILTHRGSNIEKSVQKIVSGLRAPDRLTILTHLVHYLYFPIGKATYQWGIGKWFLGTIKHLHLMSRTIDDAEKRGKQIFPYPALLPNALAALLVVQLQRLSGFNQHRRVLSHFYWQNVPSHMLPLLSQETHKNVGFLRFPLRVKNPKTLHAAAKKAGILLGDWYNTVIAPKGVSATHLGYTHGTCPNAERLAEISVNLPTDIHINQKRAARIIDYLIRYG